MRSAYAYCNSYMHIIFKKNSCTYFLVDTDKPTLKSVYRYMTRGIKMDFKLQNNVNKIFGSKENEDNLVPQYRNKVAKMYNTGKNEYNPFLDKNGNIFNKYIDYQQILDNPNITNKAKDFITKATGLTPNPQEHIIKAPEMTSAQKNTYNNYANYTKSSGIEPAFKFNSNADENNLASLDVTSELPKLDTNQISAIISKYFSKSTVIKPSDAEGIYNAQQKSGMSALAILGIGALESGYGTSNIAKQKNNIWGWNATNINPGGNATAFSQMSQGALEFANSFMKTYYSGYGAKSIQSAGTGNNPAGKGYAYYDNGSINSGWATDVGSIMKNFYRTAKSVSPANNSTNNSTTDSKQSRIVSAARNYMGTPYIWGGASKEGMDCSGFVYNALKDAGYNVDRTTAQGYRSYGKSVSRANMQPGDLVFFGSGNDASHIGIYIGNGQMIHSSGGRKNTVANPGKGVSITNVDYRSDFIEARRY